MYFCVRRFVLYASPVIIKELKSLIDIHVGVTYYKGSGTGIAVIQLSDSGSPV